MNSKLYNKAVEAINEHGILLVYPLRAKAKVLSLWEILFPRTEMNWDWSEEGDSKVAQTWRLRESLAQSGDVVYSKWFKHRATFFSKKTFGEFLTFIDAPSRENSLSRTAQDVYDSLLENSPQSTKELKASTGLRGKLFASSFDRAMKELFSNGLIVGVGEVDDGAFPSLNLAATRLHFEDLWRACSKVSSPIKLNWPEAAKAYAYAIKKQNELI